MITNDLQHIAVDINTPILDPANARHNHDLEAIAQSLDKYGQRKPIVVNKRTNFVLAGNGTLKAARSLGWKQIAVVFEDDDDQTAIGYALADNRLSDLSEFNNEALLLSLQQLDDIDSVPGFNQSEYDELLAEIGDIDIDGLGTELVEDEPPIGKADELQQVWNVQEGDLWQLGRHRLICGDCTDSDVVVRLMGGEKADLVATDPPYGMGKEKDGIANDNLYRDKLDKFQMQWWNTVRPSVKNNGSAYIFGNAKDLWRLWYIGGLKDSERLTFRSEIAWDKGGAGMGIGTSAGRSYFPSERCLFFMIGEQGFNNNADNYWNGWDNIRKYMYDEVDKLKKQLGLSLDQLGELLGVSGRMIAHWITESQWLFVTETHYKKLQELAGDDVFKRDYDELKRDYDELKRDFYATRAYFDNTHDNMTDIWRFNTLRNDERHGHATPKPVEMIARIIKSSCPIDGLTVDPFLGSGTTLIASHQTNRICYGLEISPKYCAVILQRYQDLTNETPTKIN